MYDILLNDVLSVTPFPCQVRGQLVGFGLVRASETQRIQINQILQFLTFTWYYNRGEGQQCKSVWCKTIRKSVFLAFRFVLENVILTRVFTAPSSPHSPIPLLNKTLLFIILSFPDLLLMLHMRNERGMGGKMNETGSGEWKRGGWGGGEESKIGKNALWLDLKVCGISFSERGELHLLQIL